MRKNKFIALLIAAVFFCHTIGQTVNPQVVYADTEDVEEEQDYEYEEGYVSEDGNWHCAIVRHIYETDTELGAFQVQELTITSYEGENVTEVTVPEKMRVRKGEDGELSDEYYFVTRIDSMGSEQVNNSTSSIKLNISKLSKITLPKTMLYIGDTAFSWLTNLSEVKYATEGDAEGEDAVLYSYWLANAGVGEQAFRKCEKLSSAEIPQDTSVIGPQAFAGCERLSEIELPNGIKSIGSGAFADCALTTIDLPESIEEIDSSAFGGCEKLDGVVLPPNITKIADGTFGGCESLTSIVIPKKVEEIGSFAFSTCLKLSEVTFEDDGVIGAIGSFAFQHCESLETISLPDMITDMGSNVFECCTKLRDVKLPGYLNSIQSEFFANCESLLSVTVPDSVEEIGSEAFYTCTALETVVIPKDTNVAGFAFLGCDADKLTIYTEEDSVVMEQLDSNINFYFRCIPVHGRLAEVQNTEDGWWYMNVPGEGVKIVGYDGTSKNPEIPDFSKIPEIDAEVISIAGRVFKGNETMESVQMPETVTYIGAEAFNGCSALVSVSLPENLTYIGDDAFKDCGPVNNATLPENIKYIGDYAFCGWPNVESVVIPADVEKVGICAFKDCTKLERVDFKGCSATDLKGSFDIGSSAFENCDLRSLKVPDNCNFLNESAFNGNKNLETVVLPDTTGISEWVFAGCEKLRSINIPSAVEYFSSGMFAGCEKLDGITIPANVWEIDTRAFDGCAGLTDIVIPDKVAKINSFAFRGCSGLSEVAIPEKVTSIGVGAFEECKNLAKVTIPSKDTVLKEDAFAGCPKLTIYTMSGSKALEYALENNVPYVLLDGGEPEKSPGTSPTNAPTKEPGKTPGTEPTNAPTKEPGKTPGTEPTNAPTNEPGKTPGTAPTKEPEKEPENPSAPAGRGETLTDTGAKCKVKVTSSDAKNPAAAYLAVTDKKATKVTVPDTVTVRGVNYKVTSVANKAFSGNKKIKTVILGSNVNSIGKNAFKNCTKLKSVEVRSKALNKIGANAFYGDKKLTKITIKSAKLGKSSVGKNAFKGTNRKLVIKVPSNKLKAYKNCFKNKGNKTIKVKK